MKTKFNILALTTAALSSGIVHADHHIYKSETNCDVALGAEFYVEGGTRIQSSKDRRYAVTKNNSDLGFDSSGAVHLTVKNKNFDNWSYGLQLGVKTNNISNSSAGTGYLDRTYLWIDRDNLGRFELGSNLSAASSMGINAGSVAVATGGIDGSWNKYVNSDVLYGSDTALSSDNFITGPGLLFHNSDFESNGTHERSRKITYYTPKFNGFQVGISYIPDISNYGGTTGMPNSETTGNRRGKNGIAYGLTWEKTLAPQRELKLSLRGEYAKATTSASDESNSRNFYDKKAIEFGGTYQYDNITFAASYGTHWKSTIQKINASIPDAFFYSAGVKYDFNEKTRSSLTYFYSEKFENPLNSVSLGVEHDLAPGLLPYAEATYFNMDQRFSYTEVGETANGQSTLSASSSRNEGAAIIFGAKLKF